MTTIAVDFSSVGSMCALLSLKGQDYFAVIGFRFVLKSDPYLEKRLFNLGEKSWGEGVMIKGSTSISGSKRFLLPVKNFFLLYNVKDSKFYKMESELTKIEGTTTKHMKNDRIQSKPIVTPDRC